MTGLLKSFEHRYVKPWLRRFWPWRKKRLAGIRVHYMKHLDGGGSSFGQEYIALFRRNGMPAQGRAFEWCAGPGFIGFSLLGHSLCQSLCLADINPEAVEACRRTVKDNSLSERVTIYHSDNLATVPATERWNLVVGNPPHFIDDFLGSYWHTTQIGISTAPSSRPLNLIWPLAGWL